MAYDSVRDEIVVPQFFAFAILTYRGDANGNAKPIRKIFGPHTQLKNSERLAVDPVHGEIFVPQGNAVLVFPRDGDGDVAPIRVLKGPATELGADAVAVDPVHDLLLVSGTEGEGEEGGGAGAPLPEGGGGKGQILIFNRKDSGNAKPLRVIKGPNARLNGGALMAVHPPKGWVLAAVRSGGVASPRNFVGVWSVYDNGDVAPRWTIGGPNGVLQNTRGVAIDAKHKTVIASDKYLNGVLTFEFPEIF